MNSFIENIKETEKKWSDNFKSNMVTLSTGMLAASITIISLFSEIIIGASIIISWVSFAMILLLIVLNNALKIHATKVLIWHEDCLTNDEIDFNKLEGKMIDRNTLVIIIKTYILKLNKFLNSFMHWITFCLFLIGLLGLMFFTISNTQSNKRVVEKNLDIEIKKLELEKLQRELMK